MSKKVLIISTSLRGGSNSDILAKECAKGAKMKAHLKKPMNWERNCKIDFS